MEREVKRVAMDFDWPIGMVWPGYIVSIYETALRYWPQDGGQRVKHFSRLIGCEYDDASDIAAHDPPLGDGWQMWENTTEGSPMSPVFATPEELARWLTDNNMSVWGIQRASYEKWLKWINE